MSHLKRNLVKIVYYYGVVVGLTAYKYNFELRSLERSRFLHYYSLCANGVLLLLVPAYYVYGVDYMDAFEDQLLLQLLSYINVALQSSMIVYTVIVRHSKDIGFCKILAELLQLDGAAPFDQTGHNSHQYNAFFYVKYLTLAFQSSMFVFGIMLIQQQRDILWLDVFLNSYFAINWLFLHCTMFIYFLALLHIHKLLQVLSGRLAEAFQAQPAEPVAGVEDIRVKLQLFYRRHRQLMRLIVQLNRLFAFHNIIVLLTFFATNVMEFYMSIIVVPVSAPNSVGLYIAIIGIAGVQYLDIFIVHLLCDEILATNKDLLRTVGTNQALLARDSYQLCEDLLIKNAASPLCINIYGMFNLSKREAFAILQYTIMNAIIIIQFHYIFFDSS